MDYSRRQRVRVCSSDGLAHGADSFKKQFGNPNIRYEQVLSIDGTTPDRYLGLCVTFP